MSEILYTEQDQEIERAVIGGLLVNPDAAGDVAAVVEPADFLEQRHQVIFEAISRLNDRGEPADFVTLAGELAAMDHPDAGEGLIGLAAEHNFTSLNVLHYANLLATAATKRRAVALGGAIVKDAHQTEAHSKQDVYTTVQKLVDRFLDGGQPDSDIRHISSVAVDVLEEAELAASADYAGRIPTGISSIDLRLNGGLGRGELIVLAGRPGTGKTTLAAQIAISAAKRGLKTLIFSLEMSDVALVRKMMSAEASVPTNLLLTGKLDSQQWTTLKRAKKSLQETTLWFDQTPAATAAQIRARAKRVASKVAGLDLVVVDYVQIMADDPSAPRGMSHPQRVGLRTKVLRQMAKELNAPCVALSQLNREANYNRPTLANLKDSGAIEEDADVVGLLAPDAETDEEIMLFIEKNRTNTPAAVPLRFEKSVSRFAGLLAEPGPEQLDF